MLFQYPALRNMIRPAVLIGLLSSYGITSALVTSSTSKNHPNKDFSVASYHTSRSFSSNAGKFFASNIDDYDYDELMQTPGEVSRYMRRDVMNHERWLRHRTSDRFFRSLSTVGESNVLRSLYDEVAIMCLVCIGVIAWNEVFIDGYNDFSNIKHAAPLEAWDVPVLKLPTLPFELASGALGLLLVFRANNTYDRWLCANSNWNTIVSACRSLLATAVAADYTPNKLTNEEKLHKQKSTQKLSVLIAAFPRVLRKQLEQKFDPEDGYVSDMKGLMKDYPKQCQSLLKARNPPLRAIYDLQKASAELTHLDENAKNSIREKIDKLSDCSAECESIYSAPVPRSYTHHTTRFLTIYLLLLPMALYDTLGCNWNHIGAVLATALMSFLFFGIEEIAAILEEPFTIMPLEKFTEDVRASAEEMIEWMEEDGLLDDDKQDQNLNGEKSLKKEKRQGFTYP